MKEGEKWRGGRRSSLVEMGVPRWLCQLCRHPLCVVGADFSSAERDPFRSGGAQQPSPSSSSSVNGTSSVLAASRMDQSFVVLHKQKSQQQLRPRLPLPSEIGGGGESHGLRALDESFVVLPSAASMYRNDAFSQGGGPTTTPTTSTTAIATHNQLNPSDSFNANVNALTRIFEIVSSQTQVDQPLCLECMKSLCHEIDKQSEEISSDIKAYEAYLSRLEKEQRNVLTEEDFFKEKLKIEEEEKRLEAAIEDIEQHNEEVVAELQELEIKAKDFRELEERFWHDCNDFRLQLTVHQEERDSVLAKIEVAQAQLDLLKRTNVLNDAFHIWHDGEFGTINNFRLGRLPSVPVEWDEINAAWGQACLLLSTMGQYCRLNFSYRVIPMGSYPRIADNKNIYELYGPVNLFWSTRYDKAMTLFIACLKEFADFANAKDRAAKIPVEKCFQLPYKIENDKVEGLTITQSFNRHEKWTKALKYMLCDLKWALYWLIGNTGLQPSPSSVSAISGVPTVKAKGNTEKGIDPLSKIQQLSN